MTYRALGADAGNIAEDCARKVSSDADYDTKAGREKAAKDAAECAADGACAVYKVPPGLCGPVARSIMGGAINIWNSLFGNQEEWEQYYRDQAYVKRLFAQVEAAQAMDAEILFALRDSIARIIDLSDSLLGPGILGKKAPLQGPEAGEYAGRPGPGWHLTPSDVAARVALRSAGLPLHSRPTPATKGERWFPPNLVMMYHELTETYPRTQKGLDRVHRDLQAVMLTFLEMLRRAEMKVSGQIVAAGVAKATREAAARTAQGERIRVEAAKAAEWDKKNANMNWLLLGAGALAVGTAVVLAR